MPVVSISVQDKSRGFFVNISFTCIIIIINFAQYYYPQCNFNEDAHDSKALVKH